MPEIFKIFWSLKVPGYLIFSSVFLRKNIIDILYATIWKIPRICLGYVHYITFDVKSLEYALDIQSSTIWEIVQNMLEIHYITFGVKSLEYALDIQSSTIWKIVQNMLGIHYITFGVKLL